MPIRLLPPQVISQIAAGEVVERPASVVKELVENSLDAGATQISIDCAGGGAAVVRVVDNGAGIPADEVELAFERHATSKLGSLADLEKSTSLGFRGEALPSIAAVSQVELVTSSTGEPTGTYVMVREGRVAERQSRGSAGGTGVTVRHLFRNVPARLKFLKSPITENSHIADLVTRFAMAYPEVRFTLTLDGRSTLRTSGNGSLKDVLVQVYDVELAAAMLQISWKGTVASAAIQIEGYASPPSVNRASRSYMSFFVNRRWISSPALNAAAEKAYQNILPASRYPITIINITLPPRNIDVNVHPTKRTIRFLDESGVFAAVNRAIGEALPKQSTIPQFQRTPGQVAPTPAPTLWNPRDEPEPQPSPPSPSATRQQDGRHIPMLRLLGQLSLTYIIAEGPDGLYLIDQHAAHERVLFEKVLAQRAKADIEVQGLLEPLAIELSSRQGELLEAQEETFSRFGFTLEPFGERIYVVRAVPAVLGRSEIPAAVKEILDSLADSAPAPDRDRRIAATIACHSAVRAGQLLSQQELRELVLSLEQAESPYTCPHGRPTMIRLTSGQLQREFGRT